MIFAAGLGTRLKPLTDNKPKALVEINGKTLLELVIRKLISSGFNEIIVNVHHFAEQVIDFLKQNENFNINLQFSDEKEMLLDTGGGLKKASWFFDDGKPFLVYNVDILTDFDLGKFYEAHLNSSAMATLAVRARNTSRYFLIDHDNRLCGWENIATGEKKIRIKGNGELKRLAFSGFQVLSPEIFQYIRQEGKFSIIDVYLDLMAEHKIIGYEHSLSNWIDAGRPENFKEAEKLADSSH